MMNRIALRERKKVKEDPGMIYLPDYENEDNLITNGECKTGVRETGFWLEVIVWPSRWKADTRTERGRLGQFIVNHLIPPEAWD